MLHAYINDKYWSKCTRNFSTEINFIPWAYPTIVSCNAGTVKIYNASSSLVRFENKNIFSNFEKTLLPTTTPDL
jgi:hypothetical protein